MISTRMRLVLVGIVVGLLSAGGVWSQDGDAPSADTEWSRDYLMIVGSTTVFPFVKAVIDHMARAGEIKKPMMQATGSGGGLMLFCAGTGFEDVDITCSSRRMRESEFESCTANAVGEIVEIRLGFDGIVLTASREAESMNLTFRDIWLALARDVPDPEGGEELVKNPYSTWKNVNANLPDRLIKVLGPASGSGTRTIFNRIAMEGGCDSFKWIRAMRGDEPVRHRELCRTMRDDGAYVVAGENDAVTVEKLGVDPGALALLSFPVFVRNHTTVQGMKIEGVEPTYESIDSADYPIARPLYLYAKKDHVGHSNGLRAFLDEVTSREASDNGGYLEDKGLVLLSTEERRMWAEIVRTLSPMSMD